MTDNFQNRADGVSAPARRAMAVTPHDVSALSEVPKALYVGVGGAIAMRGVGDAADTLWANVPAGAILPFRASHVRATGTTASAILALS